MSPRYLDVSLMSHWYLDIRLMSSRNFAIFPNKSSWKIEQRPLQEDYYYLYINTNIYKDAGTTTVLYNMIITHQYQMSLKDYLVTTKTKQLMVTMGALTVQESPSSSMVEYHIIDCRRSSLVFN